MKVSLVPITIKDAKKLWEMQVEAFQKLYAKYRDTENSPATEGIEKIIARLRQSFTYCYFIEANGVDVGAIRVVDKENEAKRISPIVKQGKPRRSMIN